MSAVAGSSPSLPGYDLSRNCRTDAGSTEHISFHDILSALNPLQYVPIVGTIYRAITGDTAHSGFRSALSAIISVVMGGPIGLLANIAGSAAERAFHDVIGDAAATPSAVAGASPAMPTVAAPAMADEEAGRAGRMAAAVSAYRAAAELGPAGPSASARASSGSMIGMPSLIG